MAKEKLKLGIIGLSEGNGHPYSWAAICNGYNRDEMEKCPFGGIPAYLSQEKWPAARLEGVQVTHIWTQDKEISKQVAAASLIEVIVDHPEDMIEFVDGVLLARDDAENHLEMARPFLEKGLPVFVDKPFALSLKDANEMYKICKEDHHIFTCSALRYAEELMLSEEEKSSLGDVLWVEATVPKKWSTYAIHILEPIVAQLQDRGDLISVEKSEFKSVSHATIRWRNLIADLKVTGNNLLPITFTYFGENTIINKKFSDSFSCFKKSIDQFQKQVRTKELQIPKSEVLELVSIIEKGT